MRGGAAFQLGSRISSASGRTRSSSGLGAGALIGPVGMGGSGGGPVI
jgi:hypothetical protein